MKIAIIHEWLTVNGGAEKVLSELLGLYPEADLFCLFDFLPAEERRLLCGRIPKTSFLQHLPGMARHYKLYLPLMPTAVEQFDLRNYELIISLNYAVAKGVLSGPDQLHISYVHTPMRFAWEMQTEYLESAGLDRGLQGLAARLVLRRLRHWDRMSATGVDRFLANSHHVAGRIRKCYGRTATVIHPPAATDFFTPGRRPREDFFVTVSRLVAYKQIDLIIEVFNRMPEQRLVVIGDGPERERLKTRARTNITFLGHCDDKTVRDYLRRARAFIFAAREDFGISPVEAQAAGCPVIAYGRGGALETVISPETGTSKQPPTGLFFPAQEAASLTAAIRDFLARKDLFTLEACRRNAVRFSRARFRRRFARIIDQALEQEENRCR